MTNYILWCIIEVCLHLVYYSDRHTSILKNNKKEKKK
ncbi:hypothetical protein [Enterocloster phage PMBT24]|uniref:Uncharacterized protein n=1 Tax=Enterocloster phage PMBT24 TaxID=3025413 RepID=A0AAT9TR61_9CAUD|nr:hypothetical protein [Enterocloster phage PMBT24]DAL90038.1 MAG TPA: hypothetical protein [Caudoviricetes sp.]